MASSGHFAGQAFTLAGTVAVPKHPDKRVSVPLDLKLRAAPGNKGAVGSLDLKGKLVLVALSFLGLGAVAALSTPALAGLRPMLTAGLPVLTGVPASARCASVAPSFKWTRSPRSALSNRSRVVPIIGRSPGRLPLVRWVETAAWLIAGSRISGSRAFSLANAPALPSTCRSYWPATSIVLVAKAVVS